MLNIDVFSRHYRYLENSYGTLTIIKIMEIQETIPKPYEISNKIILKSLLDHL